MSDVLVAYATRYGSTREVAEYVASTLGTHGVSVEVKPAAEVRDLAGYRAVVLGAPYFIGSMEKQGRLFLERNRAALEAMPTAIFALGPLGADEDMAEARKQLDRTIAKYPGLKPVTAEMFVGKFDPATLRGLDRLVTKPKASPLHGMAARDERDWGAIGGWAASLPAALGLI